MKNPVVIIEEEQIHCPLCGEVLFGEVKYYAPGCDCLMITIGNRVQLENHLCGYVQGKDERH
jgi:hypothetical protein